MRIEFPVVDLDDIRPSLLKNLESYQHPIDSYYEDHIIESKHYKAVIDGIESGYVSIFDAAMLTQFYLDRHQSMAGAVFKELARSGMIKEAYVSTSDRQLLVLAMDNEKSVDVQDFVFCVDEPNACMSSFVLRRAEPQDEDAVRLHHDGFFQNLEANIAGKELFIGRDKDKLVSFGIIEKSKLYDDIASIGMFVLKDERGNGYGAMTIIRLIELCRRNAVTPVAGCFSKNAFSRNALAKAGMYSHMRLLRIQV